jgi:hypothetical protein
MHERMGLPSVGPEFIVHGLIAHEPVSQRDEYHLQEAVTPRQGLSCGTSAEWQEYRRQVTEFELDRYLSVL